MTDLRSGRGYSLPDIVPSMALAQCRHAELAGEPGPVASEPAGAAAQPYLGWLIRPWRMLRLSLNA
jgi:hypothetical protein